MGLSETDPRKDLRMCNQHRVEIKFVSVPWTTNKGEEKATMITMYLPINHGLAVESTSSNRRSSGVGLNRLIYNASQESASDEELMAARQIVRLIGLYPTLTLNNIYPGAIPAPLSNEYCIGIDRTILQNNTNVKKVYKQVCVRLDDLNDTKVKYQTGFPSLLTLFGFIAVICKGDIRLISSWSTTLTWMEEWYMFFEIIYGKTCTRWVDAQDKYQMCSSTLRSVYVRKLQQILLVMKEWPRYASLYEDETYRKHDVKWEAYRGKRDIMFDNTNVNVTQPTDAESQRTTYSLYYGGNVGKGGVVFIQPCGWMGSHELCTGAVSDTHYMLSSKIFDSLNHYLLTSPNQTEESRHIKFTEDTVLLQKRCKMVATIHCNLFLHTVIDSSLLLKH